MLQCEDGGRVFGGVDYLGGDLDLGGDGGGDLFLVCLSTTMVLV